MCIIGKSAIVVGLVVCIVGGVVQPAAAAGTVRPKELRIPVKALLPAATTIRNGVESNRAIVAQKKGEVAGAYLPTWFFRDDPKALGRITGYAQVAGWVDGNTGSYFSSLASIYPDAAAARNAHDQAVTDMQTLQEYYGRVDVTAHFPAIGDALTVFRLSAAGQQVRFIFYLMAFTRGRLEYEMVLAVPVATGRGVAKADLIRLARAADAAAQRALLASS